MPTFETGSHVFHYTVKRTSRRRSVGIQVLPHALESEAGAAQVVLCIPMRFSGSLHQILIKYTDWILKKQSYFKKHPPIGLLPPGTDTTLAMKQHRAQASLKIEDSIRRFQPLVGISPNKTSIRNQKTRWGSCNRHRHLNFNWRLVLLPPELLDYVVVHEMCHMVHLDHSHRFWEKVESILPDYLERRHRLKTQYSCAFQAA